MSYSNPVPWFEEAHQRVKYGVNSRRGKENGSLRGLLDCLGVGVIIKGGVWV